MCFCMAWGGVHAASAWGEGCCRIDQLRAHILACDRPWATLCLCMRVGVSEYVRGTLSLFENNVPYIL